MKNRACYRFDDAEFLAAERRGGVYGLRKDGKIWILTEQGVAVLVPPPTAAKWEALPFEEGCLLDSWTEEDTAADYRRRQLDRV